MIKSRKSRSETGIRVKQHTQYAISSSLNAVSTAFRPVNTVDPLTLYKFGYRRRQI